MRISGSARAVLPAPIKPQVTSSPTMNCSTSTRLSKRAASR